MNKGIDQLDYFCAYDEKPEGMGLLPVDLAKAAARCEVR